MYDPNKISSSTCIKFGDDYADDKGHKMSGKTTAYHIRWYILKDYR